MASTYGSTIALLETMLNLVLLTSLVSLLDNFILTINLMDTPTKVADALSGWGFEMTWLWFNSAWVDEHSVGGDRHSGRN